MKMLYFGCTDPQSGHVLCDSNGHRQRDSALPKSLGFGCLDGGYCDQTCSQAQGRALLHHLDGWTVLAMWDRTVDNRLGSNSAFVAEGTHDFQTMALVAHGLFPSVWKRINTPMAVRLVDMLVEDKVTGLPSAVSAWLLEHDDWTVGDIELDATLWNKVHQLPPPATQNWFVLQAGIPVERNMHLAHGMMRVCLKKLISREEVQRLTDLFTKSGMV